MIATVIFQVLINFLIKGRLNGSLLRTLIFSLHFYHYPRGKLCSVMSFGEIAICDVIRLVDHLGGCREFSK